MFPPDYLRPIWRGEPQHSSGIATIALDPREADYLLDRGFCTLNGDRWGVSEGGWGKVIHGDGRRVVRLTRIG